MKGRNLRAAIHVCAIFATWLAALMLVPALTDLYYGSPDWIVFAISSAIIAVLARAHPVASLVAGCAGGLMLVLALALPRVLGPLNRAWFRLALLLNRVVSPVVMFVIYAIVIVPAGLIMQRLRDPLGARTRGKRESYWIDRSQGPGQSSMSDQF